MDKNVIVIPEASWDLILLVAATGAMLYNVGESLSKGEWFTAALFLVLGWILIMVLGWRLRCYARRVIAANKHLFADATKEDSE